MHIWFNGRYAICIYNPDKESVKIVPAPMVRMQRSIKALKARAEKAATETPSKVCSTVRDYILIAGPRPTDGAWSGIWLETVKGCD
jgi:A49-like RNA polymerase I associated factor